MHELDDYIDKLKTLPPAPRILPELLRLLNRDDVDSNRVVRLISFDPAMTASVLRLSNSACFSGGTQIDNLLTAISRLGYNQVYKLVVASTGSRLLGSRQKGYGIEAGELWQHSVATAVAAQLIAASQGEDDNLAFTTGLLHDIGKIVLCDALESSYTKLLAESQNQKTALIETEKRLLGVQHAEVGGRLLARWNFPSNMVSAVWFHHEPAQAENAQRLAACVYLGNMVAYFMGYGYGLHAFALRARADALEILNLKPDALPGLMVKTFDKLQTVQTLINVNA